MRTEDAQLARTFARPGFVPPWNWLEGALDRVVEKVEQEFSTQFKRDILTHMNYAWLHSGRFNGGGWSGRLRYDLIAGVHDYQEDISLEEAMLNPPGMDVILVKPYLDFWGFSARNIGNDMEYSIGLGCQEVPESIPFALREFLRREERKQVTIIPDQQDKEVFSFILPRDVGAGYTYFRLRQYEEKSKL